MRVHLIAGLCAFLSAGVLAAQDHWQTFEGPDKTFRFQGPGKPNLEKYPLKIAGKEIVLYSYLFVDVPYAYILGYGDYPADYIAKRKPEELLRLDRDRFVKTTVPKFAGKILTAPGQARAGIRLRSGRYEIALPGADRAC
jgi:hypothetical protein